jgi:hypothetical protein
MDSDAELYAAAARAAKALRRIPGVNEIGVGPKRVGGVAQAVSAIQVFVDRKRPLSEVEPDERIPATVEGYPTNVATLTNRRYAALPEAPPGEPLGKPEPPPDVDMQLKDAVLEGGGPISSRLDDTARGTLGLLMQDVADASKVYALTCYHVLAKMNRADQSVLVHPVREQTIVGQVDPNGSCSSSHCCDDGFSTYAQGEIFGLHTWRDMALVRLRPGTKYIGGIKGLGPVKGPAPNPTVPEMKVDSYLVRKYGNRTTLTGGRVVDATVNEAAGRVAQFLVVPHFPPGTTPDTAAAVHFAVEGDSGAAVVTPDVRVMGILTGTGEFDAKEFFPNPEGSPEIEGKVNATYVTPLNAILRQFSHGSLNPKFDVTPVLATGPNDIRTVRPHTTALLDGEEVAVRMPSAASVAGDAATAPRSREIGERVRADLSASPFGRELVRLWLRYGPEVVDLVNHDRQVLATWHRSGASAVYQHLGRLPDTADLTAARLPRTVNGAPLADCVARMHAVLARRGGPELRAVLDRLVSRLPDLAGLTYPQILAAFDTTRV